jgi:hypothetical protein
MIGKKSRKLCGFCLIPTIRLKIVIFLCHGPTRPRRFDLRLYAAESTHAAQLALAAMVVGNLDMLAVQIGQDALERMALREVEALTW